MLWGAYLGIRRPAVLVCSICGASVQRLQLAGSDPVCDARCQSSRGAARFVGATTTRLVRRRPSEWRGEWRSKVFSCVKVTFLERIVPKRPYITYDDAIGAPERICVPVTGLGSDSIDQIGGMDRFSHQFRADPNRKRP